MGLVTVAVLASVPLTGGSLRRLLDLPLVAGWLLPVALLLQVFVINIYPQAPRPIPAAVHLLSYGMAAVFIGLNRRIAGMPLIALGGAMNGIAIAVNGGTLPASAAALARAGWDPSGDAFANSAALPHPHLSWLGDNYAVPAWFPFANVFSLGDLVILLGAAVLVHRASRHREPDRERSTVPT